MQSNVRCSMTRAAAPLIAMFGLTGCVPGGSERHAACPPLAEYSRTDQARVANEVDALPGGLIIVQMLSDYTVLREGAAWRPSGR